MDMQAPEAGLAWGGEDAARALDALPTPLLLLGLDGAVLGVNAAARSFLSRDASMRLRGGRLWPRRQDDRAALEAALSALRDGGEEQVCPFPSREGGCALLLRLRRLTGEPARLMLSLHAPMPAAPPAVASLVAAFGLTRSQARVAGLCATGMDVPAMAEALGLAVETVRNHLKAAMRVTGARSQAQLVLMVVRGVGSS